MISMTEERTEEIMEKAEAMEKGVEAKEAAHKAKTHSRFGKGLMERRESFAQSSVPNAHRGYNGKTPRVMMFIILTMFIVSFILAAITA